MKIWTAIGKIMCGVLSKNRCFYTKVALHQLRVGVNESILCNSPFYNLKFGHFISMRLAK